MSQPRNNVILMEIKNKGLIHRNEAKPRKKIASFVVFIVRKLIYTQFERTTEADFFDYKLTNIDYI